MLGSHGFTNGREKNGILWMTGKSEKEERKFLLLGTVVEALLSHGAAGAESGWSAGECWLQVKLSFPVRIVCGPSSCRETAAQCSAWTGNDSEKTLTHSRFHRRFSSKHSFLQDAATGPFSTRAEE